jgi:uncharacterized membrane protein
MIFARRSSRLEAFSDATIAFVGVLLTLSLDVPKGYNELIENLSGFIPFALTFTALLLIWVAHKNFFRRHPLDDAFTVAVNGMFLFTILFYAYPVRLIAGSLVTVFMTGDLEVPFGPNQLRNLFVIYGLGWMVVFCCIALLYMHAIRSAKARALSEIEVYDAVSDGLHYLCFVVAGAISVALAVANVGVRLGLPAMAYCLTGLFVAVNADIRRRNRPDSVAAALPPAPPRYVIPDAPDD